MVRSTSLPEGPLRDKDLEGNKTSIDMESINPTVADLSGIGVKYQSDDEEVFAAGEDIVEDTQAAEEEHQFTLSNTDKFVEFFSIELLKKSRNTMKKLLSLMLTSGPPFKAIMKKMLITRIKLTKLFRQDTLDIKSMMTKIYQDFKGQSSTPSSSVPQITLAIIRVWNLGPRMTDIENSQAKIKTKVYSLRQDTLDIKSMMTKIYQDFKVVTKELPSHTKGETEDMETQDTNGDKVEKEQVSEEPTRAVAISTVRPIIRPNPEVALIKSPLRPSLTDPILEIHLMHASKVVQEDPDEPIRVPYMINRKMHYLTNDEMNAHLEKKDKIKKTAEEAKRFKMTKTEVIKIVQEEGEKIRIDLRKVISTKAGIPTVGWKVPTARRNFPLPEDECHCQKNRDATAR
nr:hypothetical protein [Tanacetum cinerariifolium]